MSAVVTDYRLPVWHVYQNGVHVLGPVDYPTASERHLNGPNDSRIVHEGAL